MGQFLVGCLVGCGHLCVVVCMLCACWCACCSMCSVKVVHGCAEVCGSCVALWRQGGRVVWDGRLLQRLAALCNGWPGGAVAVCV